MAHHSLAPYPRDMAEAAGLLLSKATGGDVPLPCAIHAGWHLAGAALERLYPDNAHTDDEGRVIYASGADLGPCLPCCTEDEGKKALAAISSHGDGTSRAAVGWPLGGLILQQALAYAMQLLQKWVQPKA
jgi:hypothetical protein